MRPAPVGGAERREDPADFGVGARLRPARVMSLLDESLVKSSELGMRPLIERVLSRRDILKA